VDHNGMADVVLVQEQGSWPNYQNYLYVYREDSIPAERFVTVQYPRGNQTLILGAVTTLRWSAAQIGAAPAFIDLDLSLSGPEGPWVPLATGIPDSGHWQWTVAGYVSARAHLRVTLLQDGESVSAVSRAFRIISLDPAGTGAEGPTGAGSLVRGLRVLPSPVRTGREFRILFEGGPPASGGWLRLHDAAGRMVSEWRILPGATAFASRARSAAGTPFSAGRYWVTFRDRELRRQTRVPLAVLP
jgi:hypothetical protein